MGFFKAIKRNWQIQQLTRKLAPQQQVTFNNGSAQMCNIEDALEDLVRLIKDDPVANKIIEKFQVKDEELKTLYFKLADKGGTVYVRGIWLPILALTYPYTLLYVLGNKDVGDAGFVSVRYRMREYFEKGETGVVA